ncbi:MULTISPECIES: MFS transporter [unclassified Nonomuraea]|uniref:MFS transporter n=1 Tax=unclassified Nonomuraea TaxID=2593643 RepID=UPI0033F570A1
MDHAERRLISPPADGRSRPLTVEHSPYPTGIQAVLSSSKLLRMLSPRAALLRAEGLRCLWRQPLLRLMALALTVLSACWGAWLALVPLVVTQLMKLEPAQYGLLLSALGAGGLVGAITVTTINRLLGRRWSMLADLIGTAAMVAAPVFTTNLWIVAAAAFLGGMGGILWTVNARTISQRLVHPGMLGRHALGGGPGRAARPVARQAGRLRPFRRRSPGRHRAVPEGRHPRRARGRRRSRTRRVTPAGSGSRRRAERPVRLAPGDHLPVGTGPRARA